MHKTSILSTCLIALLSLASCASVDCSLDSIVVWTMTFFDSETGESVKIPHELTVEAEGAGIFYNRATKVNSIILPMSNNRQTDTLHLFWVDRQLADVETTVPDSDEGNDESQDSIPTASSSRCTTILASSPTTGRPKKAGSTIPGLVGYNLLHIDHDNHPHFDAIDCPAAVFHTITSAKLLNTSNPNFTVTIDSVNVIRPIVDYQDAENIRIYINYHRPTDLSDHAVGQ